MRRRSKGGVVEGLGVSHGLVKLGTLLVSLGISSTGFCEVVLLACIGIAPNLN